MWQVVLLALVCAPLSVIGDLFASMIKRQYHIKDFGNIMPGHGGIMDRFDSFLLVVPFIYLIVHYLPLVQIN
jgi:phosphatidate cytidylyltransferase